MHNEFTQIRRMSRQLLDASSGILVVCALALAAMPASAAPVSGKLSLIVSIQDLPPITVTSAGTVDVTGTTITIAAGALFQGGAISVPVTGATSVASVQAVGIANQAATFSLGGITNQLPGDVCAAASPLEACNSGGGIGGAMGLSGTINILVVPMFVTVPFGLDGVGQGGVQTSTITDHAGFTTGAAFVGSYSQGQLTVVGGSALTADGGPGLAFVTPTFAIVGSNAVPVITTLIVPVPEPATVLLIGAGVTGLTLVRRRR